MVTPLADTAGPAAAIAHSASAISGVPVQHHTPPSALKVDTSAAAVMDADPETGTGTGTGTGPSSVIRDRDQTGDVFSAGGSSAMHYGPMFFADRTPPSSHHTAPHMHPHTRAPSAPAFNSVTPDMMTARLPQVQGDVNTVAGLAQSVPASVTAPGASDAAAPLGSAHVL